MLRHRLKLGLLLGDHLVAAMQRVQIGVGRRFPLGSCFNCAHLRHRFCHPVGHAFACLVQDDISPLQNLARDLQVKGVGRDQVDANAVAAERVNGGGGDIQFAAQPGDQFAPRVDALRLLMKIAGADQRAAIEAAEAGIIDCSGPEKLDT